MYFASNEDYESKKELTINSLSMIANICGTYVNGRCHDSADSNLSSGSDCNAAASTIYSVSSIILLIAD